MKRKPPPKSSSPTRNDESLQAIAELLPVEQQAAFYATIRKFKEVPDDDEHLMMLEVMGFLTLVWDRIPNKIITLLENVQSGLSDGQAEALQRRFEEVLKDSIDTPSYKDLRSMVDGMKTERQRFQQHIESLTQSIKQLPAIPFRGTFTTAALVWTALVALIAGAVMSPFALFLAKFRPPLPPVDLPIRTTAPPQVTEVVDYFEDEDLPPYPGRVGIYVVSAGILDVVNEGDKGIVVVALSDRP